MTTAQDWERRRKRWDAYKARVAKRKAREAREAKRKASRDEADQWWTWPIPVAECAETVLDDTDSDETSGDEYRNHQGDGPSGFDYWHDTHRHC